MNLKGVSSIAFFMKLSLQDCSFSNSFFTLEFLLNVDKFRRNLQLRRSCESRSTPPSQSLVGRSVVHLRIRIRTLFFSLPRFLFVARRGFTPETDISRFVHSIQSNLSRNHSKGDHPFSYPFLARLAHAHAPRSTIPFCLFAAYAMPCCPRQLNSASTRLFPFSSPIFGFKSPPCTCSLLIA